MAFATQKAAVAEYLATHDVEVIAEFCEEEAWVLRPDLSAARARCTAEGATLLIASTDAIGRGLPFNARVPDVPVHILSLHDRRIGAITPCLRAPGEKPALGTAPKGQSDRYLVRLCNPGPGSMRDIIVTSGGITMAETDPEMGGPLMTSTVERSFPELPAGKCLVIDHYNLKTDGAFIVIYNFRFTDTEGRSCEMGAWIDKYNPLMAWLDLRPQA